MHTTPLTGTNIPAGSVTPPVTPRAVPAMVLKPPTPGPTLPLRVPRYANTIAELQAAIGYDDGVAVFVSGFYRPQDGGGGWFQYVRDCSLAPMQGLVVAPSNKEGRYLRCLDGSAINILWTGAQAGGAFDSTQAVQTAFDFAKKPLYGTVGVGSASVGTLAVFAPPGRYRTTATLNLGGVKFYGVFGGGGDYNVHTVFFSDHSGHFIQFNYGEGGSYQVGSVSNMFVVGFHEKHQKNKIPILAASSRAQFSVSPDAVANVSRAARWSYQLNMCFFYDTEGSYLGHGLVKSVDKSTGQVILEDGTDNYSDSGNPNNLLQTSDSVVFSPQITEAGLTFVDPASAGSCALYCTNVSKVTGRTPVVSNVSFERFHCGIRIAPSTLAAQFDNVSITRYKFAGIASPVSYTTTDNRIANVYISGLYGADYGIKHTRPCTTPVFRQGAFGIYGVGGADKVTGVIEECSYANLYIPWTLQQTMADITLDGVKRYAILLGRGFAPTPGPHTSWTTMGIVIARGSLSGGLVDPYHAMSVIHSRCVDDRPPKLAIAQLSVVNGGANPKFVSEVTAVPDGRLPTLAITARLETNGFATG